MLSWRRDGSEETIELLAGLKGVIKGGRGIFYRDKQ